MNRIKAEMHNAKEHRVAAIASASNAAQESEDEEARLSVVPVCLPPAPTHGRCQVQQLASNSFQRRVEAQQQLQGVTPAALFDMELCPFSPAYRRLQDDHLGFLGKGGWGNVT